MGVNLEFFCSPFNKTHAMLLRSTLENRHFQIGANFMSIGGVKAEISMSSKWISSDLLQCSRTLISRLLHPQQQNGKDTTVLLDNSGFKVP